MRREQTGPANPRPSGTSGMGDALFSFFMMFYYLVGFCDWLPASPTPEAGGDS